MLSKCTRFSLLVLSFLLVSSNSFSAKKETQAQEVDTTINSSLVSGLEFRSIGPAFTSGRIADFAVNPKNHSEFYVGVASGNIWKTTNKGITFEPVFETYGAYSIGCLAMDKNNPNIVWAGTGENNHQRALGYGDGVYLTQDGGKSWKNMGLKNSRQIGMILIDPRDSKTVYIAAEGSAWGPGGDRGLYKTNDFGNSWIKVLHISEHTGINNVICDPRNPDILYATSEQRRRHVHTKIGGGPESGIHKSTDAGKTWKKLKSGLPTEHMGGIGIAISPQNPDVIYAIIEAANSAGGFFRSTDLGESWTKMSDHASSGQYYNEIYCDPVQFDKVYSVETYTHFTEDGGKIWKKLNAKDRHVDDHALWIDPNDNNHYMIGGDGGVYITYDDGAKWRHVENLPITQFYRVSVDNEKPFYNVYGGTQDNATLGGPSQNVSEFGVTSGEWYVTVFGDGFWSASDPENPNIVYSEWQYGNVVRYDKLSGEKIKIKPQPKNNELTYRWNWNAPLILSKHSNKRLYIAANKVFKSDNRGNTWTVISDDLTAQIDRNTWKVMGKYWSTDAVVKDVSSSQYGTIVSMDESPVKENLLYVGTDDGLIQVTNDGNTWNKVERFPGVPSNTYVSDIFASRFDENVVYASFDNRKRDDFKPYILKSTDKGKTWKSIASNLPNNGTVHSIEQDFVNPNLLFVGTEFGVFFTVNEGESWIQLKAGIPTISVRDIAIQKEECDLVLATFGRGFYILDDYSCLRKLNNELVEKPAHLFEVADALLYIQTDKIYGQGDTYYGAKNPPYGASFALYLKDVPKTDKEIRQEKEKELFDKAQPIPQPSWKALEDEKKEIESYLLFNIIDEEGDVVRAFTSKPKKGINRYYWDLKYTKPVARSSEKKFDPFKKSEGGIFVLPGKYKVSVDMVSKEKATRLVSESEFLVKPLNNTTLPAENRAEMVAFQKNVARFAKSMNGAISEINLLLGEVNAIKQNLLTWPNGHTEVMNKVNAIEKELNDIKFVFKGSTSKASFEEVPPAELSLQRRLNSIIYAQITSTSDITETSKQTFKILNDMYPELLKQIEAIQKVELPELRKLLDEMGAPYTPGRIPKY